MATSENLASIFRPQTSADSWLDLLCRENDSLTRALHKSFATHEISAPDSPPLPAPQPETSADPRRQALKVSSKGSKRKPRASKRSSLTTFISADPANFRHMVQQITGGNAQLALPPAPILKPAAQRAAGGLMPTLDTSEFCWAPGLVPGPVMGDGGLGFQAFPCFPTLHSWKVM